MKLRPMYEKKPREDWQEEGTVQKFPKSEELSLVLASPKWTCEGAVEREEGRVREEIAGPSRCVLGQLVKWLCASISSSPHKM